jgi:hypothetical protein
VKSEKQLMHVDYLWEYDLLASFGTLDNLIPKVVLLNNSSHKVYLLLHACGLWMESLIAVGTLMSFLPFSTFGSRGVIEGFGVSFLLLFSTRLLFAFIFGFMMLRTTAIVCRKYIRFGVFYYTHLDEFVLLLNQVLNEGIQRGHSPGCFNTQPLSV